MNFIYYFLIAFTFSVIIPEYKGVIESVKNSISKNHIGFEVVLGLSMERAVENERIAEEAVRFLENQLKSQNAMMTSLKKMAFKEGIILRMDLIPEIRQTSRIIGELKTKLDVAQKDWLRAKRQLNGVGKLSLGDKTPSVIELVDQNKK